MADFGRSFQRLVVFFQEVRHEENVLLLSDARTEVLRAEIEFLEE